MTHVFVSYTRSDAAFARALAARLAGAGLTPWLDEVIDAGQPWRETIDQAIHQAFAMVVIMSPDAKISEYVTYEWAFAAGAGLEIIPLLLRPTLLHPRLEALHHLDFTGGDGLPWDALIRRLREIEQKRHISGIVVPHDAPAVVRRAVESLDSHSLDERRQAIATLDLNNHAAAYDALLGALLHSMADVRREALFRLARRSSFRDRRAVPGLIAALRDGQVDVRAQAVGVLGRIDDDAALLALVDALDDKDRRVSAAARTALISRDIDRAADSAVKTILGTGSYKRFAAAEQSLSGLGVDLRRVLYGALDHDDPALRLAAVNMVGASQRLDALPRLLPLLGDADAGLAVATVLRQWDPASLCPELLRLSLNQQDRRRVTGTFEIPSMSQVRAARAASNGAGADEEETAPVQPAVSQQKLARAALNALDRRAFPTLIAHLGHPDGLLRRAAAAALFSRGADTIIDDLLAALYTERSTAVRENIVRLLGHLHDPRAVSDLIACLDDRHAQVQKLAADALLEINTEPARRAVQQWHERQQLRR